MLKNTLILSILIYGLLLPDISLKIIVFQDDNAPVHRAHTVREYIQENNINHMEWPAQSPDLNVIENRWWKLKRDLENEVHLITSVNDLQMAIRRVWENIPVDFIRNCMIQYLGD